MMTKIALGLLIAFGIGALTRWFDLPVPAPPKITGALLVLAITLGYVGTDVWMSRGPGATAAANAGSSGDARRSEPRDG